MLEQAQRCLYLQPWCFVDCFCRMSRGRQYTRVSFLLCCSELSHFFPFVFGDLVALICYVFLWWMDCIETSSIGGFCDLRLCSWSSDPVIASRWYRSAVLIDNSRYTSKTISILWLSVPSWRANDIVCRSCYKNVWLSPFNCCIKPIPSMIQAEGVEINSATPTFWITAFPNQALLGFRSNPSGAAKAQGIGPCGCAITSYISSFRLSAASIIWPNRFLFPCRISSVPDAFPKCFFFVIAENVFRPSLAILTTVRLLSRRVFVNSWYDVCRTSCSIWISFAIMGGARFPVVMPTRSGWSPLIGFIHSCSRMPTNNSISLWALSILLIWRSAWVNLLLVWCNMCRNCRRHILRCSAVR